MPHRALSAAVTVVQWAARGAVAQVSEISREQAQRAAVVLVLVPLVGALLSFGLLRYYGELVKRRKIDEQRVARLVMVVVLVVFVVLTAAFFVVVGAMR